MFPKPLRLAALIIFSSHAAIGTAEGGNQISTTAGKQPLQEGLPNFDAARIARSWALAVAHTESYGYTGLSPMMTSVLDNGFVRASQNSLASNLLGVLNAVGTTPAVSVSALASTETSPVQNIVGGHDTLCAFCLVLSDSAC